MRSKVISQPAIEPTTVDELKASLRITQAAEDSLLQDYIREARIMAEKYTDRKFITQKIESYYDDLNIRQLGEWFSGAKRGTVKSICSGGLLDLQYGPAQSITTFTLINYDNSESAYASTNYYLDNFSDESRPRIILDENSDPIFNLREENGIKVEWVAGYGNNKTDVPSPIRRAIVMMAGQLYANRGDCDEASRLKFCSILDSYKYFNGL